MITSNSFWASSIHLAVAQVEPDKPAIYKTLSSTSISSRPFKNPSVEVIALYPPPLAQIAIVKGFFDLPNFRCDIVIFLKR